MAKGKLNFLGKGLKINLNDDGRKVGSYKDDEGTYRKTNSNLEVTANPNTLQETAQLLNEYLNLINSKLNVPWIDNAKDFKLHLENELHYYQEKLTQVQAGTVPPNDSVFSDEDYIREQMTDLSSIESEDDTLHFGKDPNTINPEDLDALKDFTINYSKLTEDDYLYSKEIWKLCLAILNRLVDTRNVNEIDQILNMNLSSRKSEGNTVPAFIQKYEDIIKVNDAKPISLKAVKKKSKKTLNDGRNLLDEFEKRFGIKPFKWGKASSLPSHVVGIYDEGDNLIGSINPTTGEMNLIETPLIHKALEMATAIESNFTQESESGYVELDNGQTVGIYYEADGGGDHALNLQEVEEKYVDAKTIQKFVGVFASYEDYFNGKEPLDKILIIENMLA